MQEATWYLGPLGDMRPLIVPEPDIEINEVRYGGTHQSLSGSRTMDITGYRAEYTFQIRSLDPQEFAWLEALHTRLVPGPFYLLNPLKKNRLTTQASAMRPTNYSNSGVRFDSPFTVSRDWPDDLVVPGRSIAVQNWTGDLTVTFDPAKPIPLLPDETLTAHVWMKADDEFPDALIRIAWYDEDLVFIENTEVPVSISTTWSRHWFTYHEPPTGAASGTFEIVLGTRVLNNKIYIAAPMLEAGVTWPSDWELGGGAPLVLLDQLPTVSQRFPLRHVTLTLLEA